MRKNFDPEGRGFCVFLGGYVVISYCKSGEGAVGGQDVFIIFFSFFHFLLPLFLHTPLIFFSRCAYRRCGDDFMVVLAMLLRTTDSDIRAT